MTRDDRVADHEVALRIAFELFAEAGARLDTVGLVAVGHRVVHGGPDLYRPTLVDDALIAKLEELAPLAPLHNPPAVLGIRVARKALPDLPHVAVFDTAFFHDLPPAAATYAIDATSPSGGTSAATGFTAHRTSTSASRRRRFSMRRWPS